MDALPMPINEGEKYPDRTGSSTSIGVAGTSLDGSVAIFFTADQVQHSVYLTRAQSLAFYKELQEHVEMRHLKDIAKIKKAGDTKVNPLFGGIITFDGEGGFTLPEETIGIM